MAATLRGVWLVLLSLLSRAAPPEPPPVRAALSGLSLTLSPDSPETAASLTGTLQVYTDGFVLLPMGLGELVLSEATLNGAPVALPPVPGVGGRLLGKWLRAGTYTLAAEGLLVTPTPQATLTLPPHSPTTLRLEADGLDVSVDGGVPAGDGLLALVPREALALQWKPAAPPAPRPGRLLAEAAVGLRVAAEGAEGRAVLRYQALHEPVTEVSVRLEGPIDGFEVRGPVVRRARQERGRLVVELIEPTVGPFAFEVAFRGPAPQGPAPLLVPEADRVSGWVSLHAPQSGFLERTAQGMELVAPQALPLWGHDLAPGTLQAAWSYEGRPPSLSVRAQQWDPLDSPGTFVDTAAYEVAAVAHGRTLTRARLSVRNDKGQHLRIALPPQSTLLVARVAGQPVEVARDGEQLLVPLEKSIETLSGLISFPVEVTYLSAVPPWSRRGTVELALPVVDAPISDLRWSLTLPPGLAARRADSPARLTSPLVPLPGAAPAQEPLADRREEASVELWSRAYSAYKSNDFESANTLLEQSLSYDSSNAAAKDLLGNVRVFQDSGGKEKKKAEGEEDEQTRRIKAMARARSQSAQAEQQVLLERAASSYRAGDLDEATAIYESALEITEDLAQLEDEDTYVQKAQASALREQLDRARTERDQRAAESARASLFRPDELDTGQDDPGVPGRVQGTVTDEYGVPLPGAQVTLTPNSRGEAPLQALIADAEGGFTLADIEPGMYAVAVSAVGFSPQTFFDVRVRSGRTADLSVQLLSEYAAEEVMVVEMESTVGGSILVSEDLRRIPAGRSYQSADSMSARVVFGGGGRANLEGIGRVPIRLGRWRDDDTRATNQEGADAVMSIQGVVASEWIVFVPQAGHTLEFARQLLPAGAQTAASIWYRPFVEAPDEDGAPFVTQGS